MIKVTAKYLGIGFLLGVGFSIADLIYYEIYGKQQAKEVEASLKHAFNEVSEMYYKPGYKSFWERLEEERPEELLTFNLERAKLLENEIVITGVVTNAGPVIWDSLVMEVEAFDAHDQLFAECTEIMRDLEPGARETIAVVCPFLPDLDSPDFKEVSFRIAKRYPGEEAIPKSPNNSMHPTANASAD